MASNPTTITPFSMQSLGIYLSQLCQTMTGGRVRFIGYNEYSRGRWFRFECSTCHDNWNVGSDLFPTEISCPTELTDWLAKHKHVCQEFVSYMGTNGCSRCHWDWHQHEAAKPVYDEETRTWVIPSRPELPVQPLSVSPGRVTPIEPTWATAATLTLNPAYQRPFRHPLPVADGRTFQLYSYGPTPLREEVVIKNRKCLVCETQTDATSGVCTDCIKAALAVRVGPKPVIKTEGRMFRREENRCESAMDTGKPTENDSTN